MIERNILQYHNLVVKYQSSFGASPPPLPVSKQTINRFRTYFDNGNRGEGVSKEGNRNKTILQTSNTSSSHFNTPKRHQESSPSTIIGTGFSPASTSSGSQALLTPATSSRSIPNSAECSPSEPNASLHHFLRSCYPRKFMKAQSAEWILDN